MLLMAVDNTNSPSERNLAAYLLVLLFACVCLSILIGQRLRIARCGRGISSLHEELVGHRTKQGRLKLRVAEEASYRKLLARAARIGIKLAPPEEVVAAELAARD